MPDIQVVAISGPQAITLDWLQTPSGLLDETQQLASAVMIALNTDALASVSDVLPDPRDSSRRGWWGDLDAKAIWGGWDIGSKLWLLSRAKIVNQGAREGATIVRVERYIKTALQPFVDQRIVSRVAVEARVVDDKRIDADVTLYRGPKTTIRLEFQPLWSELFPGS